jgi:hypothetical protein
MRKRLKGPPLEGTVSIVVTDIEGFSGERNHGMHVFLVFATCVKKCLLFFFQKREVVSC